MMRRRPARRRIGAGLIALLALARAALAAGAAAGPVPPCAGTAVPSLPAPGAPPAAAAWHRDALPVGWRPAECLGRFADAPAVVVAVAARFRAASDASAILSRFGAISRLTQIRYWSVTDRGWRTLVTRASALTRPDANARRGDFTAAEVASGRPLYFMQRDNRSSGPVVYRMTARASEGDRLVVEVENVTPVKFYLLQVFPAGGLRVIYFLERGAADDWSYYSFTAAGGGASPIALDSDASFINRAVAAYRQIAGVPTDQEPPPAP